MRNTISMHRSWPALTKWLFTLGCVFAGLDGYPGDDRQFSRRERCRQHGTEPGWRHDQHAEKYGTCFFRQTARALSCPEHFYLQLKKTTDEIERQKDIVAAYRKQCEEQEGAPSDPWEVKRRNIEFEVAVGRHLKDFQSEVCSKNSLKYTVIQISGISPYFI